MKPPPEALLADELADDIIKLLCESLLADGYGKDIRLMDSIGLSALGSALSKLLGMMVVDRGAGPEHIDAMLANIRKHVFIQANHIRRINDK